MKAHLLAVIMIIIMLIGTAIAQERSISGTELHDKIAGEFEGDMWAGDIYGDIIYIVKCDF